jgi:hypothetical protein
VAQLGARFHGMEEVVGSNPTRSTKSLNKLRRAFVSSFRHRRKWRGIEVTTTVRSKLRGLFLTRSFGFGMAAKRCGLFDVSIDLTTKQES